jgi:hypothetical protein
VRDSSGGGDLAVGTSHKLGPCEQGKENLKTGGLKRATAFEGQLLISGALTFDKDQERRLIQEDVACGIDELDALGPQGVG